MKHQTKIRVTPSIETHVGTRFGLTLPEEEWHTGSRNRGLLAEAARRNFVGHRRSPWRVRFEARNMKATWKRACGLQFFGVGMRQEGRWDARRTKKADVANLMWVPLCAGDCVEERGGLSGDETAALGLSFALRDEKWVPRPTWGIHDYVDKTCKDACTTTRDIVDGYGRIGRIKGGKASGY